jgi:hypothetical protein
MRGVAHTVAQYGHAPLVWQADSCRRDDRVGQPMVKSVGVSRGGTSGTVVRREAPGPKLAMLPRSRDAMRRNPSPK